MTKKLVKSFSTHSWTKIWTSWIGSPTVFVKLVECIRYWSCILAMTFSESLDGTTEINTTEVSLHFILVDGYP